MKAISIMKPVSWIKGLTYAVLLLGIYYSTLSWLVLHDWSRADYSYGYLIPLVVLYLIWEKRNVLTSVASKFSWTGLIPLILGLTLFWLGELGGEYYSTYISFWFVLVGICWINIGWEKMKAIGFALFMILTMFPVPHFLYNKISLKLQLISSQLGVYMMHIYGMSVYREGNIIDIGRTQLQVVQACSGLRYLISLIVLGLLLAYFFKGRLWKRCVIVLSTVPIAIISNGIRIALTGILYIGIGPKAAEGFFHDFSGWFIFMFSLFLILPEMWILKRLPPVEAKNASEQIKPSGRHIQKDSFSHTGTNSKYKLYFLHPVFIISLILLGTTLFLSHSINFREKIPIKKSFEGFPLNLGHWTGKLESMDQKFIDALDLSDYVIIDYHDQRGNLINFYVAYYESQRKGESIHSPATCLPGSGWIFKQAGSTTIPLSQEDGDSIKVNRALMEKLEDKQLSYYWFPQRGRILTNAYQLKIFAFLDALTKQRTDGALVRIITPVYESETTEQAEARLKEFTRQIVPILDEYIPGKDN